MKKEAGIYHINSRDWEKFLGQLSAQYCLYAPKEGLTGTEYSIFGPENLSEIVYGGARATQPLKCFLYPLQEEVSPDDPQADKKSVVLGVKACDLKALRILDEIFLGGDVTDPFYQNRRENTLLISDDCTEPLGTCFCTLLGDDPFPQEGFDLNLSCLDAEILVEVGSKKGKDLLQQCNIPLHSAEERHLKLRQQRREAVVQKLKQINKDFKFPLNVTALLQDKYDSPLWEQVSEDCVGCCACTNICPSCHCFLLIDSLAASRGLSPVGFEKTRTWDSCQYPGFARVAAGANPRGKLEERFRNRLYCKFEYKPKNFALLACTGCGRCIEACQGKIDIREVLQKLGG